MPPPPASSSSRKRPALQSSIQPSITSYFTSSQALTSASGWPAAPRTAPNEPPPSVKSGLLNVGMRVRKAVSEGHKSGTYKAQTFAPTSSSQENVLPQPISPRKNKREHELFTAAEDMKKAQPIEQPRRIAIPKSVTRKYHAAVPRGTTKQDTAMEGGVDDFEEAGFLRPVS